MSDTSTTTASSRRPNARDAKRAARTARSAASQPYIVRKIPRFEVVGEEGLAIIEDNADRILEEVGIEFREDPEVLDIWRKAGASVEGERVRMPRGMCRELVKKHAPAEFTQLARNPARDVRIGGDATVFAPAYGSPFVRNLDEGRRYARIEDFRNFVKLAYMANSLHHSGGTICEPVDLPVNKRHLDMLYSHIKYSDKAFMGSVTAPERAADSVEMARIALGDRYLDPLTGKPNTALVSLINVNSPMTYDATMLGALKVYARANQCNLVTPFILAGAMAPVTVAGTATQTLAEALAGMALVQLLNPGAPVIFGSFASSMSMQSGAPTFGTPEPALVLYVMAALSRRLGVPFRSGGGLCASKIADAQAAYESAQTMLPTCLAGVNFVLHTAGWLEGGLAMGYEKFMMDVDQAGMFHTMLAGVDVSPNGQAMDAIAEVGPGKHFLGCAHTQANFETAFYRSPL
ncbi:MAG: trimethylamine methyltransferase family protein, partial [Gammaproteobacteria bacterium]|nr:trimethylamine methyltransferase family protein [Gammaproteobacteria bacterium]